MKIIKSLFKTEIEYEPGEFRDLINREPTYVKISVFKYLQKNFGLNIWDDYRKYINKTKTPSR